MKILVTGATGLLGSDLCRVLKDSHEVVGWARHAGQIHSVKVDAVDGTRRDQVEREMRRLGPDGVIHCAAMTDVDACENAPEAARQANAEAVGHVARWCEEMGTFLIAISTDYVFDGQAGRPYKEEDRPHPLGVYGQTKRLGEELALSQCRRALVVRVSGLFGSARRNFVTEAVRHFQLDEKVPAVGDQRNSPSYTMDVAQGIARILPRLGPLHGLLHLANQGGASRMEVAREVASVLGAPEALIQPTSWQALNRPARRPADSRLECGRYVRISGMALRPWQEALRAFLSSGEPS